MSKIKISTFFRGIGQVFLQENSLTGFVVLCGVAINSLAMLSGLVLGSLVSLLCAKLFRYKSTDIDSGFYGFNGALIGVGVFYFYGFALHSIILIIIGAILSSAVMNRMLLWQTAYPPYTMPFVLVMWAIMLLGNILALHNGYPNTDTEQINEFFAITRGVSQVLLQSHWLTGLIFFSGVALHSFTAASWVLIGSSLGLVTARCLGFPEDLVMDGFFGFNAILTAIALVSRYPDNVVAPITGIILSVVLTRAFQLINLPPLTAPFILSSWVVILSFTYLYRYKDLKGKLDDTI